MSTEIPTSVENTTLTEEENKPRHLPPAEFARIFASKVFADDDVGRNLLEVDLLRGLVGEEKKALTDKLKGKEMPTSIEVVKLYGGAHLTVDADDQDKNPHFLLTNELNGCAATVLLSENAETDRREAVLTHFPPFMEERNLKMIADLATEEMKAAGRKKILIFCQKKRSEWVPKFVEKIQAIFGTDAEVEIVKYENQGGEDDGVLLIRIPKKGEGSMSAHHSVGDIPIDLDSKNKQK